MILSALTILFLHTRVLPSASAYPTGLFGGRLIVFGDSLSDDEHGAYIVTNGSWPADPAYYGHHFSNGPVWAQYVSGNFSGYKNYAIGGATSNNSAVQGYTGRSSTIPVPDVITQIQRFLSNDTVRLDDVYAVYAGANDFFFDTNITGSRVAQYISNSADTLIKRGAKHLLFMSLPDLGTLPAINASGTAAVSSYRQRGSDLRIGLQDLTSSLRSRNISSSLVDVYSLFRNITASPEMYGLNASIMYNACLTGAYAGEGNRTLCSDPERRIYFDTYHPQTNIHRLIGDLVYRTISAAMYYR